MLQEETIGTLVKKVAKSLAEAICERPDNWQPSGALQTSHLQCQEEAVLEWKAYVEHWLQLRVVKTTSSQREKKESAHSVTLTHEASNTQVLAFHVRTAAISRRAQKATAVKETKRLKELEKLAVKVAKAATENLKTSMSRLAPHFAQEKKTKLKKNNRSRKQERLRLRNSEDPAARSSVNPLARQRCIQFLFWLQDKRKREDQLQKDRERKRKAYAKKKNELQELKQRHKAGPTWHWNKKLHSDDEMLDFFPAWVPLIGRISPTLQDIEEGRNTLLKELSVKDWLGHACSHCSAGTRSLRHGCGSSRKFLWRARRKPQTPQRRPASKWRWARGIGT